MPNAIQYAKYKEKWANEVELHLKEKERINNAVKHKYNTDEQYKNKCIEKSRVQYRNKRNTLLDTPTTTTTTTSF